jgi:hypothetical protein
LLCVLEFECLRALFRRKRLVAGDVVEGFGAVEILRIEQGAGDAHRFTAAC